jgi:hypothetical protein
MKARLFVYANAVQLSCSVSMHVAFAASISIFTKMPRGHWTAPAYRWRVEVFQAVSAL